MNNKTIKQVARYFGYTLSFIGVTILAIVVTLISTVYLLCKGPSTKAKELFVTTFLETGQMKFMASLFMDKQEINKIISNNNLSKMDTEIKGELIDISKEQKRDLITIEKITGDNFEGTMMIVSDPSKISLGTTYPWTEYGRELDKIVKSQNAIAGINGGLYVSAQNKGGTPRGLAVSNGEILKIESGIQGMHLIGFDNKNILRVIDLSSKSVEQIKEIITTEKIRDAVAFQDSTSDKNNHFVKLIINGEKRQLNGLGSGANPRTAIGQRKDGSILLLVTDGRGKNGHLGATASDLIDIMSKYEAINAANLDGGSSSSMYYKDKYLMTSVTFYYANSSWKLPTAFVVKE